MSRLKVASEGKEAFRIEDPARMAQLELQLWQDYYAQRYLPLMFGLLKLARGQFALSWAAALRLSALFGKAAWRFKRSYQRDAVDVTPELAKGYALLARRWGREMDCQRAAEAEQAWWEARRNPEQSDPDDVGDLIAEQFAILSGGEASAFQEGARLRARAAALRDAQEADPDWARIGSMLHEAYEKLSVAIPAL